MEAPQGIKVRKKINYSTNKEYQRTLQETVQQGIIVYKGSPQGKIVRKSANTEHVMIEEDRGAVISMSEDERVGWF